VRRVEEHEERREENAMKRTVIGLILGGLLFSVAGVQTAGRAAILPSCSVADAKSYATNKSVTLTKKCTLSFVGLRIAPGTPVKGYGAKVAGTGNAVLESRSGVGYDGGSTEITVTLKWGGKILVACNRKDLGLATCDESKSFIAPPPRGTNLTCIVTLKATGRQMTYNGGCSSYPV
jgi:hypothetical protein